MDPLFCIFGIDPMEASIYSADTLSHVETTDYRLSFSVLL